MSTSPLKLNYYVTFYWIKFLHKIWDYYNQALLDINFSDFSPFTRLWIVFFNDITEVYRVELTVNILKSKLTNISYKDMQNLSSPSDCIQFSVSDNERMMISCIAHISDSRNSTEYWSWGVETQTGFGCFSTKYIQCRSCVLELSIFSKNILLMKFSN